MEFPSARLPAQVGVQFGVLGGNVFDRVGTYGSWDGCCVFVCDSGDGLLGPAALTGGMGLIQIL